jgi:hypothetical protein
MNEVRRRLAHDDVAAWGSHSTVDDRRTRGE